ncbi:MAG: hypothetical protein RI907_1940 [Pseudomonadota bacterium]|jgi:hypothetical protein
MITYQSARWWQRPWLYLLTLIGVVAALAVWGWPTVRARAEPTSAGESAAQPAVAAARRVVPESALLVAPQVMDDGRPSDFSPEDWAALKEAMSRTPNPRTELERVVKYLRFQKGFEQWQSLQGASDVAKRHQLAEKLLAQVPERLSQSEVTFAEASLIQSALVADLEPNEALRKQKLDALQEQLKSAAPQIDPQLQARNEALEREYKRREAAIVADYQARPEAQRDHAKLEKDLQAARQSVWGSSP